MKNKSLSALSAEKLRPAPWMPLAVRYDEHDFFKCPDRKRISYVLNRFCCAGHPIYIPGQASQKLIVKGRASVGGLFHLKPSVRCRLLALNGQSLRRNSLSAFGQ